MFRLGIIEDEALIRDGLQTTIDWNRLGFTIVGAAANGKEALACWSNWRPDAVLTDIQMPDMDGLQFLEAVKKISPSIEVVLLSGHARFSYAQRGLSLGAFAYILKVDLYDEVESVFTRLRLKLEEKNAALQVGGDSVLERWLRTGNIPDKLPADVCSFRIWVLPSAACLPKPLQNTADVLWKCSMAEKYVVLQMSAEIREESAGNLETAFFSRYGHHARGVVRIYEQTLLEAERCIVRQRLQEQSAFPDGDTLWKWALHKDERAFQECVHHAFLSVLLQEDWPDGLSQYRMRLLGAAETMANIAGIENWSGAAAGAIEEINVRRSYLATAEILSQLMARFYSRMKNRRRHAAHYIQEACEFIDRNLRLEITLSEISQYFYLSPSYFSSLFKRETGKTFSLYVQEQRIRRAAALCVSTKLRNLEIAQLCGFKDEHYMVRLFKSYYGVTISAYRSRAEK